MDTIDGPNWMYHPVLQVLGYCLCEMGKNEEAVPPLMALWNG